MSGEARELFAAFDPRRRRRPLRARTCRDALQRDFAGDDGAPPRRDFQDLLVELPAARSAPSSSAAELRRTRSTSEWLIRDADGKEYKPEDYLTAFAAFVAENADQIEAIRILLDRPQRLERRRR